jgi:hypothetical protein
VATAFDLWNIRSFSHEEVAMDVPDPNPSLTLFTLHLLYSARVKSCNAPRVSPSPRYTHKRHKMLLLMWSHANELDRHKQRPRRWPLEQHPTGPAEEKRFSSLKIQNCFIPTSWAWKAGRSLVGLISMRHGEGREWIGLCDRSSIQRTT